MIQRFTRDESGMTLGLAMIMILLISVMGAGLLTFANRDLNSVVEDNRGQTAFGLAEAGVGAAKRQLSIDCTTAGNDCRPRYNDTTPTGDDIQWSSAKGGLTLNNLDGDNNTADSVNVQITSLSTTDYVFKITSTGTYRNAKRKIETIFKGVSGVGGGGPPANPGYYTPSNIMINGVISLAGVSLFSEGNIIIKGLSPKTRAGFQADASTNNGGVLQGGNSNDPLCDWYSPGPCPGITPGNWNLVRRLREDNSHSYTKVGFAAEGKICSPTSSTATNCATTDPSVADGVYGYDSTTGDTTDPTLTDPNLHSNLKTFYRKDPECTTTSCPTPLASQPSNKITYPFPLVKPDPARLKGIAQSGNPAGSQFYACPNAAPAGCSPPWATLFPDTLHPDKVIFIDANGNDITFNNGTPEYKAVMVVWCGRLTLSSSFRGIIINLYGDGSTMGLSSCDNTKGVFTLAAGNQNLTGWVYALGGTGSGPGSNIPGIVLGNNSKITALPGGGDLANVAFGTNNSTPTSFAIQGWRELYQ